jgi:hypothetical protein
MQQLSGARTLATGCADMFVSGEAEAERPGGRGRSDAEAHRPVAPFTDLDRKLRLLAGGPVNNTVARIKAAQVADQKRLTDLLSKLHPVEEQSPTPLSIRPRPEFEMLRHLRTLAEIEQRQSTSIDELVNVTIAAEKTSTRRWRIAMGLVVLTLLASIVVPLVSH